SASTGPGEGSLSPTGENRVGVAAIPASANRAASASRVVATELVRTVTGGGSLLAGSIASVGVRPERREQGSTSQRGWTSRTERYSARSASGGSGSTSTPATLRRTAFTNPAARERPSCFNPSTVSDTAARRGMREWKI